MIKSQTGRCLVPELRWAWRSPTWSWPCPAARTTSPTGSGAGSGSSLGPERLPWLRCARLQPGSSGRSACGRPAASAAAEGRVWVIFGYFTVFNHRSCSVRKTLVWLDKNDGSEPQSLLYLLLLDLGFDHTVLGRRRLLIGHQLLGVAQPAEQRVQSVLKLPTMQQGLLQLGDPLCHLKAGSIGIFTGF